MLTRNSFILLLVFSFAVVDGMAQTELQDVVYLKDGNIVRGVIVEQIPNTSLKIRTDGGSFLIFTLQEIARITKEPRKGKTTVESIRLPGEKSPFLASVLSFLLPGGGQYYLGETTIGLVQTSLYAGGIAVALALGRRDFTRTETTQFGTATVSGDEPTPWLFIGLGVSGATLIWSIIDGASGAKEHNLKLLRAQQGNLSQFLGKTNSVSLNIIPAHRGVVAQLSLQF